MKQWQQCYSK